MAVDRGPSSAHAHPVSATSPRELGLVDSRSPQALADLHSLVAAASQIGLSVESDTRHAYTPRLALVSLAVVRHDEVTVVSFDPIESRPDRGPVEALMRALAHAPLLVHGGEHPLALLRRQSGLRFPALIDTQQAAILLGLPRTGLRALARELLAAEIPAVRSVDWSHRPLDVADLEDAQRGAALLPELWQVLSDKIAAHDLEDELAVASKLVEDPPLPPLKRVDNLPDPKRFRQITGAAQLSAEGLAVLSALTRWRDQKARELDLPPIAIFSNAQLVELATSPDHALQRLAMVRFHSRLVHSDQQSLRLAILTALSSPPEPRPPTEHAGEPMSRAPGEERARPKGRPDTATRERIARLKVFRRDEAARRGVGLMAILPAVALEHLAFFPRTALAEVPGLGARRIDRYGATLTALLG
jgi:ribonuclease D